ncbi:hypothetical protein KR215_004417 [Drosophila sulfurigaster]|nr:hypothetical protein KR215_004417 [Drosophila sulfurigaster]
MWSVSFYLWSSCTLASFIGSRNLLMPVVKSDIEYNNILRIVSLYNKVTDFKNFVLFVENSDEDKTSVITPSLQQRIMEFTGRPMITAGSETGPLDKIINSNNIAMVLYSSINDPILNVVHNTLSKIYHMPIIFVYNSKDVVPYLRPISPSKYYNVLFSKTPLFVLWALYVIAMILIRRFKNPHIPVGNLILETVQISLGQILPSRVFNCRTIPEKIVAICTWIFNIFTTCAFGSIFATIMTTGIYMPKIVDIDSFVTNDISIMVTHDQMKEVLKIDNTPRELMDRMFSVDQEILNHHLNSLNDSYVYLMETHRFAQIEFLQQRLWLPKFKLAPEPLCALNRFLRLPVRQDAGYFMVLRRFVVGATESGLTEKWMRMGLQQLKKANIIQQAPYEQPSSKPLSLTFYIFAFQIYGTGILLSIIVIFIECINEYYRNNYNNHGNVIIV